MLEKAAAEIQEAGVLVFYTGVHSPLLEILQVRLQEALRRIGHSCEVRFLGSSQRALAMANDQGDGDLIRVPSIKELAPELTANLLVIPESIIDTEFYVYTSGALMDVENFDSLQGLQNGFRVGIKILEKKVPSEQVILPDSERLLRMLDENRLDTVIEHSYIADYLINKFHLTHIKKQNKPILSHAGFLLIHEKHKELVPQISSSLAEMKVDGTFEKLKEDVFKELMNK